MGTARMDYAAGIGDNSSLRPLVMGTHGVVAAGHYLAARVGEDILSRGGNAIDAGVAAGLAINVLLFDRTSFGGVAPIIIYHAASRQVVTLDGLGVWPALADREYLAREYGVVPEGILRSVTPAAPDAWLTALARFGQLSLGEVMEPALELARDGAPLSTCVAGSLRAMQPDLDRLDATARDTFFAGGRSPGAGTIIAQPELAEVFGAMIDAEAAARRTGRSRAESIQAARDLFYRGWIAERIDAFHQANGGWIRAGDLARHAVEVGSPLQTTYNGDQVYTCGPWCQGPLLIQFLNILENFDLPSLGHNSAAYLHLLVEAMDLALSDRENYYGDPRQVDVPIAGLISKEYGRRQAARISMSQTGRSMPDPGNPWALVPIAGKRPGRPVDITSLEVREGNPQMDTSYVAAVDGAGNLFSATPSDPIFATPMIPGLGLSCSGRGSQSRVVAGHPSALAPGRRPRLTPNPALLLRDGEPLMAFGCPGADGQTQAMLQFLLNVDHFGMNLQQAIEAPRIMTYNYPASFAPHQYYPGRLDAETRVGDAAIKGLRELGHQIRAPREWISAMSAMHAVAINPANGVRLGAADPRRPGAAVGR